ncbi:MAG: undecaprenyl/decaprenyl-phosphate alpha-N-acetylglucosaminyl 1-phosphate transferase [Flavonifractor sp.]|nr:undecaprenyl/decaprenyl-phosphate alpha-N-acetylglucosaminyl 1-phosphate transferase [Flavonifractor sp.]MCI9424254.1 undecaprenyl/decaprenyl-phosphate alpha-N-acetylglucosaminyl 1-phosphate transferase [Flavonifractor sp.]MCI9472732.1 undecaprenyl/decaprenyl-phosphate alpha-N-acetylglucosaminyl 1-phosphate transferase [Flavonifractor sp.]
MPMKLEPSLIGVVAAALVVALLISLVSTPVVKNLAAKVGAVDVPKDNRRMHDHPIPRMGGLAIFFGFVLSVLIFAELTPQLRGMLLGASMIVVLGIFDDIYALKALPKLFVQIAAALVAVCSGNVIEALSNPNIFSSDPYWELGILKIPFTVLWIVAITNAVNLIDGLDGLACGVSTISSMTLLVISLVVADGPAAVLMAALAGGCIGFLPYNLNPAKIFMGDTGATFLGYVLAVVSIQGLFKFYTIISFAVPFLMLGLPIFDTCFAFIRRIAHGQSPMHADRSHVHHRLIDMGFSQKQAVAVLYIISAILGLSAVVLTTAGAEKAMLLLLALCAAGAVSGRIFMFNNSKRNQDPPKQDGEEEAK